MSLLFHSSVTRDQRWWRRKKEAVDVADHRRMGCKEDLELFSPPFFFPKGKFCTQIFLWRRFVRAFFSFRSFTKRRATNVCFANLVLSYKKPVHARQQRHSSLSVRAKDRLKFMQSRSNIDVREMFSSKNNNNSSSRSEAIFSSPTYKVNIRSWIHFHAHTRGMERIIICCEFYSWPLNMKR